MKKVFAFVVACMMAVSAFAAEIDLKAMGNDELKALIDAANDEMFARVSGDEVEPDDDDRSEDDGTIRIRAGAMMFDKDGVRIKIVKDPYWEKRYDGKFAMMFDVIIDNGFENEISLMAMDAYVNGWSAECSLIESIKAGKKASVTIEIYDFDSNAGVKKLEDIDEVTIGLYVVDAENYDSITDLNYELTMVV